MGTHELLELLNVAQYIKETGGSRKNTISVVNCVDGVTYNSEMLLG